MAKKKRTSKSATQETPLEAFASSGAPIMASAERDAEVAEASEGEAKPVSNDVLLERISQMQKQLDQQERDNLALLSTPNGGSQNQQREAPKLDLTNLPNPIDDPEGYAKEMNVRYEKGLKDQSQYLQETQNASRQQDGKVNELWDNFSERYPQYADDPDKVEFAALKVAKAAQRRGVDLNRYMFQTQEKYMRDVAQEFEKSFGTKEEADDGDDEADAPADRSIGIMPGGKGPTRAAEPKGKKGDLISDLHELQIKTGFY